MAKWLAKGLTGDRMGDITLWGHEKKPTLGEKFQAFHQDSQSVTDQIKSLTDASLCQCHIDLNYTLNLITSGYVMSGKLRTLCKKDYSTMRS